MSKIPRFVFFNKEWKFKDTCEAVWKQNLEATHIFMIFPNLL